MSDHDADSLLHDAFGQFRGATLPFVRPRGADAAYADAHHRRRARNVALAAAATVLVLTPAATYASLNLGRHAPSVVPGSPTPTSTATPTPAPSESAPAPSESAPGPTTPPSAATAAGELANATFALAWSGLTPFVFGCPSGPVRFTGGAHVEAGKNDLRIRAVTHADVDRDGGDEVIALVECVTAEATPKQVVAVKRGSSGTFTTLARVVATAGDIENVHDIAGAGNEEVRVLVADIQPCCGTPGTQAVLQWRTYAFSGGTFRQTAGPTTFLADRSVADVTVMVPTVSFAKPAGGFRRGTLVVTLRNKGPQVAQKVSLFIDYGYMEPVAGGDWTRCPDPGSFGLGTGTAICALGSVAVGQEITLTLPVRTTGGPRPTSSDRMGLIQTRTDDLKYDGSVQIPFVFA